MQRLDRLSLETQIGYFILVSFPGPEPHPDLIKLIERGNTGWITLYTFNGNVITPSQTRKYIEVVNVLAEKNNLPLPFMAIDQEDGVVARVARDGVVMPGNMALGAAGDPELAYRSACSSGAQLRAIGFNVNFAPVIDINTNPHNPHFGIRCYGDDPELVKKFGVAAQKGFFDAGILPIPKHFPGLGDTETDDHFELSTISHTRERFESVEFVPFREIIKEGARGIMVTAVNIPELDPDSSLPSLYSKNVIRGILQFEMGFEGLVISDAINMGKQSAGMSLADAAVKAFQTGVDIISLPHASIEEVESVHSALVKAVKSGEISEKRFEEALAKVMSVHNDFILEPKPVPEEFISSDKWNETALEIAQKSITLVRDINKQIPIRKNEKILLCTPSIDRLEDQVGNYKTTILGESLIKKGYEVKEIVFPLNMSGNEMEHICNLASTCDQIILATFHWLETKPGDQVELAQRLFNTGEPVIQVSYGNPYDTVWIPEISTSIACYGFRPSTQEALADIIAGEMEATGSMPVKIIL